MSYSIIFLINNILSLIIDKSWGILSEGITV